MNCNCNSGFFCGNNFWWIIILLLIFCNNGCGMSTWNSGGCGCSNNCGCESSNNGCGCC